MAAKAQTAPVQVAQLTTRPLMLSDDDKRWWYFTIHNDKKFRELLRDPEFMAEVVERVFEEAGPGRTLQVVQEWLNAETEREVEKGKLVDASYLRTATKNVRVAKDNVNEWTRRVATR